MKYLEAWINEDKVKEGFYKVHVKYGDNDKKVHINQGGFSGYPEALLFIEARFDEIIAKIKHIPF